MERKGTFSVEKAKPNSAAHNSRKNPPKYLIGLEPGKFNFYKLFQNDADFIEKAKRTYKAKNRQSMQQKQIQNLVQETVLTLKKEQGKKEVMQLFKKLHEKFGGHQLLELSIHRDEGHFEKDGITYYPTKNILKKDDGWYIQSNPDSQEFDIKVDISTFKKIYNYHAHAKFTMFDKTTGKTARMQKHDMSNRIKFISKELGLVFAPDKRTSRVSKTVRQTKDEYHRTSVEKQKQQYNYRMMQKQITELTDVTTEQKKELHRLNSKVNKRKEKLEKLKSEIERFKKEAESKDTEIERFKKEAEAKDTEIERFKKEAEAKDTEIATLKVDNENLTLDADVAEIELSAKNTEISTLNKALQDTKKIQDELDQAKSDLKASEVINDSLTTKNKELEIRNSSLETKNRKLESAYDYAFPIVQDHTEAELYLRDDLALDVDNSIVEPIKKVYSAYRGQREENIKLKKENAELQEENSKLKEIVNTISKTLGTGIENIVDTIKSLFTITESIPKQAKDDSYTIEPAISGEYLHGIDLEKEVLVSPKQALEAIDNTIAEQEKATPVQEMSEEDIGLEIKELNDRLAKLTSQEYERYLDLKYAYFPKGDSEQEACEEYISEYDEYQGLKP